MNFLKKIKQGFSNFWSGRSKNQKRVLLALGVFLGAVLNAIVDIPVLSFLLGLLLSAVAIGIVVSVIIDLLKVKSEKDALAGNVGDLNAQKIGIANLKKILLNKDKDSTTEGSSQEDTVNKKSKKKDGEKKLSKKEAALMELSEKSKAEYANLRKEHKVVLDDDTQEAMDALFTSSTKSAPEMVELKSEKSNSTKSSLKFDDVFGDKA